MQDEPCCARHGEACQQLLPSCQPLQPDASSRLPETWIPSADLGWRGSGHVAHQQPLLMADKHRPVAIQAPRGPSMIAAAVPKHLPHTEPRSVTNVSVDRACAHALCRQYRGCSVPSCVPSCVPICIPSCVQAPVAGDTMGPSLQLVGTEQQRQCSTRPHAHESIQSGMGMLPVIRCTGPISEGRELGMQASVPVTD
jgi:hypothetical protein